MNQRQTSNPVYTAALFDAHDLRGIPPLNSLKAAWDKPLRHEDPLMDEERRLLSVAQYVRDCLAASAPALLEACKSLIASYEFHCPEAVEHSNALKKAREAIAQEEGHRRVMAEARKTR